MIKFYDRAEEGKIVCDDCGEEEFITASDFKEFVAKVKDIGWKIVKIGTEYEHYCYSCHTND